MLSLRGVTRRFGATLAVAGVHLDLRPATTTVLIGPSGCGKSTLLRMMVGLVAPDEGRVLLGDEELGGSNLRGARLRMGYVIQEGGLFPHLTARRNVTLVAGLLGWDPARLAGRIEELADLVRLDLSLLDRYPVQLSGGQSQRVSLMRALMLDPEVLLLDEPLGALDPMIRSELSHELKGIFEALHKTVVLVTHDLSEAAFFADTVVLLQKGRIIQSGPVSDLLERPADPFVSRFVGAQRSRLA